MSTIPSDLKYTKTHEWLKVETDGTVSVGITDHAQQALGDVVFLELPEPGRNVEAGEECAVVESVKAASDIYAPVSGEVIARNDDAIAAPEKVNQDPYGTWLFKLKVTNPAEIGALLDADAYAKVEAES
ncbi:MAG: glycine cleavage system protein GcvH [Rhodocyclaceae bacterium]